MCRYEEEGLDGLGDRRFERESHRNTVEGWFAQLERRSIYRGVFTSAKELREEIHRFIKVYNAESAKPFKWAKSASVIINSVERAKKQINKQN